MIDLFDAFQLLTWADNNRVPGKRIARWWFVAVLALFLISFVVVVLGALLGLVGPSKAKVIFGIAFGVGICLTGLACVLCVLTLLMKGIKGLMRTVRDLLN